MCSPEPGNAIDTRCSVLLGRSGVLMAVVVETFGAPVSKERTESRHTAGYDAETNFND